jgi:hypothetical protein
MKVYTMSSIGILLAIIAVIVFLGPFLLLVGINFIIEPLNVQLPFDLGTWFGAFLIMLVMKTTATQKS